jgi:putative glycosyltransferase (TIGR04348 family)
MRAPLTAFIATPAASGTRLGNRITALRWAKRLRELGCRVRLAQEWRGEPCDLLVALHARRSHASIARHAASCPAAPRFVALTGTDLYGDIHRDDSARESLELATRLILLQPFGLRQLPERLHDRAAVIRQSAVAPRAPLRLAEPGELAACVLGHLRDVKDPWLAAAAARRLPPTSRLRIHHLGGALDDATRRRAEEETAASAGRWQWVGEHPRAHALRALAGSDLLLLTSVSEGGANVVTEAIACGVPVISTRIDGSLGILGDDYPGYVEVGDAAALANLLARCEVDPGPLAELRRRVEALRPLVDPALERRAWRTLLPPSFDARLRTTNA